MEGDAERQGGQAKTILTAWIQSCHFDWNCTTTVTPQTESVDLPKLTETSEDSCIVEIIVLANNHD